ncbi:MAG: class I mannose-6-phosphate isomerase [Phycisphaerae bacterium]|nr:class I mannose-6-phosphate isomerase [Phycisphaerae bacterium]
MSPPYPLLFEPILLPKVWGGRRLEAFGKRLPEGEKIGESWELADLGATSAGGAGGGAQRSVIANGPLAGKTLHDAMADWRDKLLGSSRPSEEGGFPLLVKLLDASENLSVQTHPSPEYVAAHAKDDTPPPLPRLKTECWYVLAAETGSVIYKGVKPGVTRESFARRIKDGTVAEDLVAVPAVVGECHVLPSGTVHALGKGVLVAEVQTPSDTTYRVFDWGRKGRELHVEQALACIEFGAAPAAGRLPGGKTTGRLVSTDFFSIHESSLPAGGVVPAPEKSAAARVVIVLSGEVTIRDGNEAPVRVGAGATALVPAALAPTAQVVARPKTRVLLVTVR